MNVVDLILATETAEREFDFGLLAEADQVLDEVAEARRRLEAGTYGICQTCGGRIPAARLAAVPAARFCVVHERALEPTWAGGAVARTTAASRRMRA
jgi:RNA polymerase-binding transcription factor DksA